MKNMKKENFLACEIETLNLYDKVRSMIRMYMTFVDIIEKDEADGDVKMRKLPRFNACVNALAYYAIYGYTQESREECCRVFKMSKQTENQLTHFLTKNHYLEQTKYKNSDREVAKDIKQIYEVAKSGKTCQFIFNFKSK